jgi:predicted small metal-binding protein
MVKIECPICDRDVRSSNTMGLGDSFKGHLMDTHRMTSLACIDMTSGVEPPMEVATYEERREVTVERPIGTARTTGVEERSTLERMESKGSEVVGRTESRVREVPGRTMGTTSRTTDVGTTGTGRVVDVSTPRRELEEVRRTAPEFMIKCPFCNEVLRADDDDELGKDLKHHWGDVHQIRPTIRAEMGMSRGR